MSSNWKKENMKESSMMAKKFILRFYYVLHQFLVWWKLFSKTVQSLTRRISSLSDRVVSWQNVFKFRIIPILSFLLLRSETYQYFSFNLPNHKSIFIRPFPKLNVYGSDHQDLMDLFSFSSFKNKIVGCPLPSDLVHLCLKHIISALQ